MDCLHFEIKNIYRLTHLVDSNLLLTSKQKFRFGLARSGQARPIRNFCFGGNGRFESRRCVTLYITDFKALGIHDSWRHLSLPWLAQCKPSGPAQACSGEAKARIDGTRSRVYLVPNRNNRPGPVYLVTS